MIRSKSINLLSKNNTTTNNQNISSNSGRISSVNSSQSHQTEDDQEILEADKFTYDPLEDLKRS